MSHDHSHGHSSDNDHESLLQRESNDDIQRRAVLRRLYQASFLCTCFIIVEVVGGLMAHSLAILSDAAHLFADLASFAVAIAASYLASMPATRYHTFGLKRTESLAALFSMISLAFVSIGLGFEAVRRLVQPPEELVEGKIMSGIASIGVLVNIALAGVLGENHVHLPGMDHSHAHEDHQGHDHSHGHDHKDSSEFKKLSYQNSLAECDEEGHSHGHDHGSSQNGQNGHDHDHGHAEDSTTRHEHFELHSNEVPFEPIDETLPEVDRRNINLRAAYLHVLADLAQSVAVLIAGLIIWARPDWHVIDPILTLMFACLVLYSTIGVLRVSVAVLLEATPPNVSWRRVYEAIRSVPNVTDVHDLHIWSISHGQPSLSVHCRSNDPQVLRKIRDKCLQFGIEHATIQVQTVEGHCLTCEGQAACTRHLSDEL